MTNLGARYWKEELSMPFVLNASAALEENEFEGMGTVFNNLIDTWPWPTRILPGAFNKTLEQQRDRIKILWQHNVWEPIGKPRLLEETETGIRVIGKISMTDVGQKALTLMRDKVVDELSIGWDPLRDEMVEETSSEGHKVSVRYVHEARLWEISPVTWGANNKAKISDVNSLGQLQESFEVQAVRFPKEHWKTAKACREWLSDRGFRADKPEESRDSWDFSQRDRGHFVRLREKKISDREVIAIGGPLKEGMVLMLERIVAAASEGDLVRLEKHGGKVFSANNAEIVARARKVLDELLSSAEPSEGESVPALTEDVERLNKWRLAQYAAAKLHIPIQ